MPDLNVIAGCNGAGKSTFASSFLPEGVTSFDFDRLYLENYYSLPDSEIHRINLNHIKEILTNTQTDIWAAWGTLIE